MFVDYRPSPVDIYDPNGFYPNSGPSRKEMRSSGGFGEGRVGGGGVVDGSSLGFVPRASGPMGVAAERETHSPTPTAAARPVIDS